MTITSDRVGRVDRVRRMTSAIAAALLLSAPATVIAQHAPETTAQTTKPAVTGQPKSTVPTKTKASAKTPSTRPSSPPFSDLRAALARIQQRVTEKLGASANPQTAVVSLPKPAAPKAEPSKAGDVATKPAESASKSEKAEKADTAPKKTDPPAAKANDATSDKPSAPVKRIELNWRSPLIWPKELDEGTASGVPPSTTQVALPFNTTARISLIWR